MGGRGGSSGLNNSSVSVGQKIQIGNYVIQGGTVTTPSGKSQFVLDYRELSKQEKEMFADSLKKAGISDAVVSGDTILPRNVAESAINRRKAEKAAIAKNVPGLNELRSAMAYDSEQRSIFNRSVESGSGILKGNPSSKTASAVEKKYPRASAYLTAESFYHSSNHVKASYGKEAMNKIASGKSATAAIKEMKKKWSNYVKKKAND